ncbi:sulfotransferase [Mucilaginibacter conchicola]|uniref:Sulfotransferase n=1 Tax=Mucilaginibacter conchicola TaxID=2303333 RepID=A0A372NVH8_9SPHI|nr:sulfotransferase [Mucilaginibacter conchicola]RFZ94012.1 sulfotransferase [Mucilaginibacter conchicola]
MRTTFDGIQIIGTQRSGSNLLRVILDQSDELASPHPPHILTTFVPLLPLYGDMDETSYRMLVNDVVDYVNANPVPWDGIMFDKKEIFRASRMYSLYELNRLIYEQAAKTKQARYWCCKSMANVHYADELEAAGLNLKYIYLYRDGRDVAASFKKAVVGEKHAYHLAKQWQHDQAASLRLEKQMPADRFYKLNYETLIAEPESTVKQLCAFLDIPYVESMLSFYESKNSKLTAEAGEMWSNLKKPIIKDNTGKYNSVFKDNDLQIFELVAGSALTDLGYQLHSGINESNKHIFAGELLTDEKIKEYTAINTQLKKETLVEARPSDLENRRPQEEIVKSIKARATMPQSV